LFVFGFSVFELDINIHR